MRLFHVATLFVMCGIALCADGKSGTPQKSATKEAAQQNDIPKSIAESVSGMLQFAEGNFIGLAEAMPETSIPRYLQSASLTASAALGNK